MKMSRLERALLRARPYVHNPERFPDASNIGKRFRVLRNEANPELVGKDGVCELPLQNQRLQLKFEDDAGKPFEAAVAFDDLVEVRS
jgi:hypothetical protein